MRGATVFSGVPRPPNWQALRKRLRACIVATVVMALFLGFWQFAIPGKPSETADTAADIELWGIVVAVWLGFPNSLVFATSASRSLWRGGHRAAACLPIPGFLACAIGLPILANLAGFAPSVMVWAFPAGLLISASGSVAVIVREPVAVAPAGAVEDTDQPHAYTRDVPPDKSS